MIRELYNCISSTSGENIVVSQHQNGENPKAYTYDDLRKKISGLQEKLTRKCARGARVGIVAENSFEWIAADLALLFGGYVAVPIPLQFSSDQVVNMMIGMDAILADASGREAIERWGVEEECVQVDLTECCDSPNKINLASAQICKVIHTSGTTSRPKGVIISTAGLDAQLKSLMEVVPRDKLGQYLSLVPYSLLIEQISGIYMPILCNGEIHLLPSSGDLLGSTSATGESVLEWIVRDKPTAAVIPPAVVAALDDIVSFDETRRWEGFSEKWCVADCFFMSGGAPISEQSLLNLRNNGISVYQGYGLSENTSVVAWNTPDNNRLGSVGIPLPHNSVSIDPETSEILVKSRSLFVGYQVEDPTSREVDAEGWLHTGDVGWIDDDGFLFVTGRMKNTIITSAGRNISPEWVESVLRSTPGVEEAVLIGNELPHPVAIILADQAHREAVTNSVKSVADADLNEVERPGEYLMIKDTENFREEYFTVTGRPVRSKILDDYKKNQLKGFS